MPCEEFIGRGCISVRVSIPEKGKSEVKNTVRNGSVELSVNKLSEEPKKTIT